jgi:hypothetical protein
MKKILLNIALFAFVLLCFYGIIFIITPAGSYGAAYVRVASPQYPSLILGSSDAARGLSPVVMQQSLGNHYQFPMMNFSFNIGTSPYGEIYFNRIAEKLKKNESKNSLFILSVSPYNIGDYETEGKREEHGILAQLRSVTSQPNWEYLFKNVVFSKDFVTLNFNKHDIGVDKYGFDASDLDMATDAEWKVRERIETHILPWYEDDVIPNYRVSEERLAYLGKIINLLKENGDVFLVRMPFEAELFEITDAIYPNFDDDMRALANKHNVHFISFWTNPSNYRTTDGIHLYKIEAERISRDTSDSIRVIRNLAY